MKEKSEKEEEKEEIIVITARCIDMVAHADKIDKIPCSECGEMTWLSISWRGRQIDKILCEHCFEKKEFQISDYNANITETCLKDAIKGARKYFGSKKTDKEIKEEMMKIMEKKIGKKINIIK